MLPVLEEINRFVYCVPPNVLSPLPNGGGGYLEVIDKYSQTLFLYWLTNQKQ